MNVENRCRELIFRYGPTDIKITSPEQLVECGIQIHHDVIEETWGPDAVKRYKEADTHARLRGAIQTMVDKRIRYRLKDGSTLPPNTILRTNGKGMRTLVVYSKV